jgi:hypothetical protein
MNEFQIELLNQALHIGYVMVLPVNENALKLRDQGLLLFVDAAGRFGYVRATLTEKGTKFAIQNQGNNPTKE